MSGDPVLAALARLEAGQADVMARMDRLEQGQTALRADLMARIDRLQDRTQVGMDTLRTELMARMDRLQDSITAIRDDIGVNMGAADHAKEAANGTRRELRSLSDVVSAMRRQIERLQTQVRELRGEP